jgi:NAD(P)-dependent dehydrogenase (short-subunit alcohol dehydrogenase family)
VTDDQWLQSLTLGFMAAVRTTRAALPSMLGDHGVAATVGEAHGVDPAAVAEQQADAAPTGRFTEPEQVADLVVLLAGERAGNVTGSDFVIDGGLVQTL